MRAAARSVGDRARPVEPGHDPRWGAGPRRIDGEVEREVRRGRVDADLGQPAGRRDPGHPFVGPQVIEQRDGGRRAVVEAEPVVPGRDGQKGRSAIGQEVDIGIDPLGGGLAQCQDPQWDPWVVGRDRHVDRRPVTDSLATGGRCVGIEHGREEDRRARGIEVEDLGRVGWQAETVLGGPLADRSRTTAQHGHIERVDADLHEFLGRTGGRRGGTEGEVALERRLRLADEPLERPVAALLDARRDAWQWRQ